MTSDILADQSVELMQPLATGPEQLAETCEEKRKHPRLPFRGRAKAIVFPLPSDSATTTLRDAEVITNDISRGGVSIMHRDKLVPGQQMLLMLNDTSQMVEVCWCCRVWDGLYAAGCRFLSSDGSSEADQRLAAIDVVISGDYAWWDAEESK